MAISVGNTGSGSSATNTDAYSFSFNNNKDYVIAYLSFIDNDENDVTATATYNSVSMGELITATTTTNSRRYRTYIFGLDNGAAGANTLAFATSLTVTGAVYGAICISGQMASPAGDTDTNTAGCTNSITTTKANSLIVACAAVRSNTSPPTLTKEASDTQVVNTSSGYGTAKVVGGGSYRLVTTATTYTVGFTASDTIGDIACAVEIREDASPTVALGTPADAGSVSDTTPDLTFTGTDTEGSDIRYNIQINDSSDLSAGTNTYYFDGSDAGATDPNNVWSNDANAVDGNTGTTATTSTLGSNSSNFLKAEGTNAPSSGGRITQVRARTFSKSADYVTTTTIFTDGLAESLGAVDAGGLAGYTSYTTLSTPSGGWTWAKIQALEMKVFAVDANAAAISSRTEIEVTTAPISDKVSGTDSGFAGSPDNSDPFASAQAVTYTVQSALTNGATYYWRVRGIDPSGSNTYGAWATTRSFTVSAGTATNSTRAAKVTGKATANSNRSAKVTGKLTASAVRGARVTGFDPDAVTVTDTRGARVKGKDVSVSTRSAKVIGFTENWYNEDEQSYHTQNTGGFSNPSSSGYYVDDP